MYRLPREVNMVLDAMTARGFHPYLVGGCVRDLLLGSEPSDYDMTSDALPEEVMAIFGERAHPTGLQHGTVSVCCGGRVFEITTMRMDGVYHDLRHPDAVTFTDRIELDLARRDFTINAMALSPKGELTDLFGGREDLRRGILRTVGEPRERFSEDALRILRLLRFASVLGFCVEENTADAARELRGNLQSVAAERIRVEMDKLLCGKAVSRVLLAYPDILGAVIPELLPCVGFEQRNPHHTYDVWTHTAKTVENVPPDRILRWTMFFHDLGKPQTFTVDEEGIGHMFGHTEISRQMASEVMKRLRFDRAAATKVDHLLNAFDDLFLPSRREVYREAVRCGKEEMRLLLLCKTSDGAAKAPDTAEEERKRWSAAQKEYEELLAEDACFSLSELRISGNDLKEIGFCGKDIGAVLEKLLQEVVKERVSNEKEDLLARAQRLYRSNFAGAKKQKNCLQ